MSTGSRGLFGKLPWTPDPRGRDVMFADYADLGRILDDERVPAVSDWDAAQGPDGLVTLPDREVLGNDRTGDCVPAAVGHFLIRVAVLTGAAFDVTEQSVLREYAEISGYDPTTGANDIGCSVRDVLKRFANVGMFGTKAAAFAAVDPRNKAEVTAATWLGGGIIGGYDLPAGVWDRVNPRGDYEWYVPAGGFPSGEGSSPSRGYCMYQPGSGPGLVKGRAWGGDAYFTHEWALACEPELWVIFHPAWVARRGRASSGFAYDDLLADVRARQQE